MTRRGTTALQELAPKLGGMRFDLDRHKAAALHTANRAGLVMTNDIEVVVEGRLGRDGVIRATDVLAKCGSRYEAVPKA